MQLFYSDDIDDTLAKFAAEEARHCVQVLRKKIGDTIHFVDGQGTFYAGSIIESSKKKVTVNITERTTDWNKSRDYYLHIGIAPTKNNDRYEWFLEKATEIGVDEITPIITNHSERRKIRKDRYEKVLVSAMKQSLSARLPKLNPLTKLDDFLKIISPESANYIAYCGTTLPHLKSAKPSKNITILIGPEGDFTVEEFKKAKELKFQGISLGKSRLRTETAGVFAVSLVNLMHT